MKKYVLFFVLLIVSSFAIGQEETPNPFDFGKMWTFENPPKEWFKEAYDFEPGDEWFDDVRKSSLKFASWCSASFVSPDGLIMTNHHCSRDVVGALQKDGENFDKNGYYAHTLNDERRAEDLFVDQLMLVKDITKEVKEHIAANAAEISGAEKTQSALSAITDKYKSMSDWSDLTLKTVTYYSGGKYSLYGYKRYNDIRLVLIPELDLGFYGGDADNFTYPRYNLDCTFWRAYDEDGKPLDTSENYFQFNPEGASEGEPVFVVGNPARTERYRTVAQLKYDRDYRYPMTYKFLKNRNDVLVEEYEKIKNDPSKEYEVQALLNEIAGVSNGMKAYGGIVRGLNDAELFNRKVKMENYIRSKSPNSEYWDELSDEYEKLNPHGWAIIHLQPSGLRGRILQLLHGIYAYRESVVNGDESKMEKAMSSIESLLPALNNEDEIRAFKLLMREINEDIYPKNSSVDVLLKGRSTDAYVDDLLKSTSFTDKDKAIAILKHTHTGIENQDPLIELSTSLISSYRVASEKFMESSDRRKAIEEKIANQAFNVYGTDLPPDATFTLRISDGVVKGYNYNGTEAPHITTYFGLYDRHYSHGEEFPWSLPEKWMNPPMELLKSPMNTVSTNDIIGGNSGSPLINKNKEAVGLIFDGNIESLPGNFIFDEDYNRTVSVHAGGIIAAFKYIYKADRLVNELLGQ